MKTLIQSLCIFALLALVAPGCVEPIPAPPRNLNEYNEIQQTHPQQYATFHVKRHNIQRVLDPDLPVEEREASLELISNLAGPGGGLPLELSAVLAQKDCPPSLRSMIQSGGTTIASKPPVNPDNINPPTVPPAVPPSTGGGTVGRYSMSELRHAPAGPKRTATLRWLIRNPQQQAIVDLVKLWAAQSPNGQDEELFRKAVGGLGTGQWHDVLMASLNAKKFGARGSALSVLAARGGEINLLSRFKTVSAQTVSVQTIQAFANKFGYIPANGGELLACVILQAQTGASLDAPASLAARWKANYRYKFNIRDYHLLNQLASDPTRSGVSRSALIKRINAKLGARRHVARSGTPFAQQTHRPSRRNAESPESLPGASDTG